MEIFNNYFYIVLDFKLTNFLKSETNFYYFKNKKYYYFSLDKNYLISLKLKNGKIKTKKIIKNLPLSKLNKDIYKISFSRLIFLNKTYFNFKDPLQIFKNYFLFNIPFKFKLIIKNNLKEFNIERVSSSIYSIFNGVNFKNYKKNISLNIKENNILVKYGVLDCFYNENYSTLRRNVFLKLKEIIKISLKKFYILDGCCGVGINSLYFKKYVSSNSYFFGVDINKKVRKYFKDNLKKVNNRFYCSDLIKFLQKNKFYDLIIVNNPINISIKEISYLKNKSYYLLIFLLNSFEKEEYIFNIYKDKIFYYEKSISYSKNNNIFVYLLKNDF